ncbi:ion-transporting P-type ATPase [Paratrimastix pyriformis]|uniref:Ion-transporting P-type ATPase n=1 Tax=Paratrimastix pyriformis TaxID=342808 RepID=A0ABQ8UL26_9EUKA|nr:ion-transporting P-type ATPase [Paratrimastix pyriformis]
MYHKPATERAPSGLKWSISLAVHILTLVSSYWSIRFRTFLNYRQVAPGQATCACVLPLKHHGHAQMCPLKHNHPCGIAFTFQRRLFVWNPESATFLPLENPLHRTFQQYVDAAKSGYEDPDEEVSLAPAAPASAAPPAVTTGAPKATQGKPHGRQQGASAETEADSAAHPAVSVGPSKREMMWGKNEFDIPMPTFWDLFQEHLMAPFFLFQMLCVFLWLFDEYWHYSLLTLVVLVAFEATVVLARMKNLRILRGMAAPASKVYVYRNKRWVAVMSDLIFPEDIVSIARPRHQAANSAGQPTNVPCDALLLAGQVVVNEALLTGESVPVVKVGLAARLEEDPTLAAHALDMKSSTDRVHVVLRGTEVMQAALPEGPLTTPAGAPIPRPPDGGCPAFVLRTGFATSQGKLMRTILFSTERVPVASSESVCFIGVLLTFAIAASLYVVRHSPASRAPFKVFLNISEIITSVVPPELPMQMSLANIFCTESFRIPEAGKLTVCCFDKTGTLTDDELLVEGVAGLPGTAPRSLVAASAVPTETGFVLAGCHSLALVESSLVGDPLDRVALLASGWSLQKGDTTIVSRASRLSAQIVARHPFLPALRRNSAILQVSGAPGTSGRPQMVAVCKGAPEAMGPLYAQVPAGYEALHTHYAREGARVLALGYKTLSAETPSEARRLGRPEIECGLTFAGLLVLSCPIRDDSLETVTRLRESSHQVVMVTGDHLLTAVHVAQSLNMIAPSQTLLLALPQREWQTLDGRVRLPLEKQPPVDGELCLDGPALEALLATGWKMAPFFRAARVFARMSPALKERVVAEYRSAGCTVLMCGDGTNDVAGIKHAQVGMALLRHASAAPVTPAPSPAASARPTPASSPAPPSSASPVPDFFAGKTAIRKGVARRPPGSAAHAAGRPAGGLRGWLAKMQEQVEKQRAELAAQQAKMAAAGPEADGSEVAPVVRLGDASIAAPFTSKLGTVRSVCDLIIHGRCTLATVMMMYRILALGSLLNAYQLSVLALLGVKPSDNQMTVSSFAVVASVMLIARSPPLETLSPQRPHTSIFSAGMLLSLVGQFGAHMATMLLATRLVPADVMQSIISEADPDGVYKPTILNTIVFLVGMAQNAIIYAVNFQGRPFMQSALQYRPFMYSLYASFGMVTVITLRLVPSFNEWLELSPMPLQLALRLLGLLAADLVVTFGCCSADPSAGIRFPDFTPPRDILTSGTFWSFSYIAALLLALTSVAAFHSYELFHFFAEILVVFIHQLIFVFTIHTAHLHKNAFIRFLGTGLYWCSCSELLHVTFYLGMGFVHNPHVHDWSLCFHTVTEIFQTAIFVVGVQFFLDATKPPPLRALFFFTGVPFVALVTSVFLGIFPLCSGPNNLPTVFQRAVDLAICLFVAGYGCLLYHRRRKLQVHPITFYSLMISLASLCIGEFFLVFWQHDADSIRVAGHLLKIVAAYSIYFGVLRVSFLSPYKGLFHALLTQRNELERERNFADAMIGRLPVAVVVFSATKVLRVNEYLTALTGLTSPLLDTKSDWCHTLFQTSTSELFRQSSCKSLLKRAAGISSPLLPSPSPPTSPSPESDMDIEMDWSIQPLSVVDPDKTHLGFVDELHGEAPEQVMVATGVDVTLANRARRILLTQHRELDRMVRARTADLEAALAELRQRTTDLAAARDSAESAARAKTTFLNSMSHELRTPLTAILGCSELLQDSLHTRDVQEATLHAASIRESGQRLLDTVNDPILGELVISALLVVVCAGWPPPGVLDMARFESGRFPLHLESLDAVDVVRKALGLLAPLALKKGLRLALRTNCHQLSVTVRPFNAPAAACHLPFVLTPALPIPVGRFLFWQSDPSGLRHIINNLVGNSIKSALPCRCVWAAGQFTAEGHVEVRILRASAEPQWIIEVEDTGCGMSADFRKRIFQPFSQESEGSTRRYDGSGLGLSLVRMYVSVLGGSIDVTSQRGKGTTFHILLPLISVPPPSALVSPSPRVTAGPTLAASTGPIKRLFQASDQLMGHGGPAGMTTTLVLPLADPPDQEEVLSGSHARALPSMASDLPQEPNAAAGLAPAPGDSASTTSPEAAAPQVTVIPPRSLPPSNSVASPPPLAALVVEDNLPCALVCRRFLAPLFSRVDVVHSPDEAIVALARAHEAAPSSTFPYAMIFMDIDLGHPTVDGVVLLRDLRVRFPAMEAVPALATTAHILQADRDELMQTGLFAEVVGKPYSRELLLETAQRHLQSSHPLVAAALRKQRRHIGLGMCFFFRARFRPCRRRQAMKFKQLVALVIFCLALLAALGFVSYPIFHIVSEALVVFWHLFVFFFTLHTAHLHNSHFLRFIGVGLFWTAIPEFLHALSYKGVGIIEGVERSWSAKFHVVTDVLQCTIFMAGLTMCLKRSPSVIATFFMIGVPTVFAVVAIFLGGLPDCWDAQFRPTLFEVTTERLLSAGLALFGVVLIVRRRHLRVHPVTVRSMVLSMGCTAISNLLLSFFLESRRLLIIMAHLFKLLAAFSIYYGTIRVTFVSPFQAFFRSLVAQRNELERERNFADALIGRLPVALIVFSSRRVLRVNEYMSSLVGMTAAELDAHPTWSELLFQAPVEQLLKAGSHQSILRPQRSEAEDGQDGDVEMDWLIHPLRGPGKSRLLNTFDLRELDEAEEKDLDMDQEEDIVKDTEKEQVMIATGVDVTLANRARRILLTQHRELDRMVRARTADLEAALAELRQRTTDLAAARDSAESAARAKTTFLNSMSHELRTPLTAILGCSELLQDSLHTRDVQEATLHAASIRESGQRLLDTVNDPILGELVISALLVVVCAGWPPPGVLDMARFESGRFPLHLESLDAVDVVRKALGLLAPLALKKGLRLALRTNCHQLSVTSDPSGLRHIINNLVGNSIKSHVNCVRSGGSQFTATGHVTVRLLRASAEPQWVIEVEDTGCGMSADFRKRIFQPFSQESEGSTRRYDGSGLGLSLVRMYVSVLGGSIDVTSQRGKGTTFHILLPMLSPAPVPGPPSGRPTHPDTVLGPLLTSVGTAAESAFLLHGSRSSAPGLPQGSSEEFHPTASSVTLAPAIPPAALAILAYPDGEGSGPVLPVMPGAARCSAASPSPSPSPIFVMPAGAFESTNEQLMRPSPVLPPLASPTLVQSPPHLHDAPSAAIPVPQTVTRPLAPASPGSVSPGMVSTLALPCCASPSWQELFTPFSSSPMGSPTDPPPTPSGPPQSPPPPLLTSPPGRQPTRSLPPIQVPDWPACSPPPGLPSTPLPDPCNMPVRSPSSVRSSPHSEQQHTAAPGAILAPTFVEQPNPQTAIHPTHITTPTRSPWDIPAAASPLTLSQPAAPVTLPASVSCSALGVVFPPSLTGAASFCCSLPYSPTCDSRENDGASSPPLAALVVEDNLPCALVCRRFLAPLFTRVDVAHSPDEVMTLLDKQLSCPAHDPPTPAGTPATSATPSPTLGSPGSVTGPAALPQLPTPVPVSPPGFSPPIMPPPTPRPSPRSTCSSGSATYAMVFMDIDLGHPSIDGVSLLRLIRTRFPAMEAVPALATTAHILQADRDELMQTGLFAEVVGKPYSRELLLETAQRHLQSSHPLVAAALRKQRRHRLTPVHRHQPQSVPGEAVLAGGDETVPQIRPPAPVDAT